MSQAKPTIVIRAGNDGDTGFIAQHWVSAIRSGLPRPQVLAMDDGPFNRFHYQTIEAILKRAVVRVAGPPDDESTIYGVAVLEKATDAHTGSQAASDVIHFVFVRPSFRKWGIAKELVGEMDPGRTTITTWSPDVGGFSGWILNKYKGFKYVPYYMREGDEDRKRKRESRYTRG